MFITLLFLALTGCVEDVGKDKTAAVVEDVKKEDAHGDDHAAPAAAKGTAYKVDVAASKINALGAKVSATHPVDFKKYDASVTVDGGKVTGIEYTIDMTTFESDHPKLTEHLKNEDFFDVPNHPTSTFKSTEIKEGGEGEGITHTISGEMMIRGETKKVTFPAKIAVTDAEVKASAEFVINRQDFKISYPGRADDLIQDNVAMTIEFVAKK